MRMGVGVLLGHHRHHNRQCIKPERAKRAKHQIVSWLLDLLRSQGREGVDQVGAEVVPSHAAFDSQGADSLAIDQCPSEAKELVGISFPISIG